MDALKQAPTSLKLVLKRVRQIKYGQLTLHLPNGRSWTLKGEKQGPAGEATFREWNAFSRILSSGDIGLAEAFMAGEVDSPDLTEFLKVCSLNFDALQNVAVGRTLTRWVNALRHRMFNRNSRNGSRKNILAHYDLGNTFYERWLDQTMTYSSALFADDSMSLEQAQLEKYRRIARQIGARPGAHILEIGCGWGGFAEVAAGEFGAHVTSLTISDAQHAYASARMERQGLSDLVDIRLQDYRDVQGRFDGVASIEMFEAVGEEYWPDYFDKIAEVLTENGRAALQIITIDDDLFAKYRKRADFIQRYVFPGGMLPSHEKLSEHTERSGLTIEDRHMFGRDYAKTLKIWAESFEAEWDKIRSEEFDERFHRLWRFYLSYCEAGFWTGRIDVGQFTLMRS
ncbi:MAG: SAM-dependent methyltransferase [Hirschia sp.]|nr:SAM-dependent methyltransferase [Hirschia sp.]MBF19996.1 SAM-dependent methyltransferase [Hirschia sp.]|tara:strand:- start:787 stop:1980 length:1194 start_codon:yes stop_codon:yes gene_type:complete